MNSNDNGKQQQQGGDAPLDLMLARAVRELEPEIQPTRDLWVGIERRIAEQPQRSQPQWQRYWIPVGVAASLMMAASALTLSIVGMNTGDPQWVSASRSVDRMESEFLQVRNPMLAQFTLANKNLAPETLNELYQNIDILAQARRDIEAQVRANPQDPQLVEKLMQIHEQELELLKQDYLSQSRSM